jgi:hypothetical protein
LLLLSAFLSAPCLEDEDKADDVDDDDDDDDEFFQTLDLSLGAGSEDLSFPLPLSLADEDEDEDNDDTAAAALGYFLEEADSVLDDTGVMEALDDCSFTSDAARLLRPGAIAPSPSFTSPMDPSRATLAAVSGLDADFTALCSVELSDPDRSFFRFFCPDSTGAGSWSPIMLNFNAMRREDMVIASGANPRLPYSLDGFWVLGCKLYFTESVHKNQFNTCDHRAASNFGA